MTRLTEHADLDHLGQEDLLLTLKALRDHGEDLLGRRQEFATEGAGVHR